MEPPLPKGYFLNAILLIEASATSWELVSKPLAYALGNIRQANEKVTDEYGRSSLAFLKNELDLTKLSYFHIVGST